MQKNRMVFMIGVIVVSILGIGVLFEKMQVEHQMATWIWDSELIDTDVEEIASFVESMQVDKLYVQYSPRIENQIYKTFNKEMSTLGVEVYALDGGADWGIIDSDAENQFTHWFSDYQANSTNQERFKGIHLDIEPYLLPEWENNQPEIVKLYQKVMVRMKKIAEDNQSKMAVDIPFWFDEIVTTSNDKEIPLARWIIRHVDEINIMAYRNSAEGKNGIMALSDQEIQWANDENKEIYIAVETGELPEEHTSFYNMGLEALNSELEIVKNRYKNQISGIAIHYYDSWRSLSK